MRLARNVRRYGKPVSYSVPLRLTENQFVLGAFARKRLHVAPEETLETAVAGAMHRIGNPKAALVKPAGPILGIVVDANTPVGSREEIDMVAQREPGTAHARAGFLQQIGKTRRILHPRDVERKSMRSVHRRHCDPWQQTAVVAKSADRPCSSSWPAGDALSMGRPAGDG